MRKLLWIAVVLAGCGQPQPAGPSGLPSPERQATLVQWISSMEGSGRVTSITLDVQRQLRVARIGPTGFSIYTTQTKLVEWQQAEALVTAVVDDAERAGCAEDLPDETFHVFTGPTGRSVHVEGCEAPDIEAARKHLRSLVRRYLPDAGV
jgi:hypothetical protein